MSKSNADVATYFALEQPRLRAFIRSLVFDPTDVDDILQEVAVIAIENADRYDHAWPLQGWIIGIAKKRILKYYESRKRQAYCFDPATVESLSEIAVQPTSRRTDALEMLQDCLSKLDDERRELLLRRHSPGVTARALAQEIGYTDTRMSRLINGLYVSLMKCVQQQMTGGRVATAD